MNCQAILDQQTATLVLRKRLIVVLVFLLGFSIADQARAQRSFQVVQPRINVVQPPIDVVQVPIDVVQVPTEADGAPIDVVQVPTEADGAPIDVVQVPIEADGVPDDIAQVPTKAEKAPVDMVQVSTEAEKAPVDVEQAPSKPQYFELDNDHSSLLFAVSHAGLSYTYGRFEKCGGRILLKDNLDDSYFRFEVDVASINTNSRLRDDHLRGPEFFDVKKFPKISFRSTKVRLDETTKNYVVAGLMTMHGVQRRVKMPITMIGVGKGPLGKARGGFITKFTIQRSDFGIDSLPKVIGDQIAITFSFEALLKDAPLKAVSRSTPRK